jgi:hypothetical protein
LLQHGDVLLCLGELGLDLVDFVFVRAAVELEYRLAPFDRRTFLGKNAGHKRGLR